MIANRFWILLAKKTSEEISAEEEKELMEMLSGNPGYHVVLEVLDGLQPDFDLSSTRLTKEKFTGEGWKKLSASLSAEDTGLSIPLQPPVPGAEIYPFSDSRRNWVGVILKWAAVMLVLMMIGGGIYWWKRPVSGEEGNNATPAIVSVRHHSNNSIVTRKGSRTNIELPDGSTVLLHGSTRLTYADGFSEGNRKISLEGEAFFDIKKDPEHPFIIQTDQIIIRVLGTAFKVRAYTMEKKTVTTLVRGLIEVQLKKDMNRHILLHPNEVLTITEGGLPLLTLDSMRLKCKVSIMAPDSVFGKLPLELDQIKGKLPFKNEPFEEIAAKMAHWYNVKIIFETPTLKKEVLAGAFFENESLKEALSALQLTTPFQYTIKADTVYLRQ